MTWNDSFYGPGDPRTGNFVPDCDLRNVNGSGECGPWSDRGFGQVRAGTRFAKDATEGFNKAQYNWQTSVSLQQELRPGIALNVGYFRTWYGNFQITDNAATTAADYDPFCITLPTTDPRLPGAGQQRCGFFDIKPSLFGRVDNLRTLVIQLRPPHRGLQRRGRDADGAVRPGRAVFGRPERGPHGDRRVRPRGEGAGGPVRRGHGGQRGQHRPRRTDHWSGRLVELHAAPARSPRRGRRERR